METNARCWPGKTSSEWSGKDKPFWSIKTKTSVVGTGTFSPPTGHFLPFCRWYFYATAFGWGSAYRGFPVSYLPMSNRELFVLVLCVGKSVPGVIWKYKIRIYQPTWSGVSLTGSPCSNLTSFVTFKTATTVARRGGSWSRRRSAKRATARRKSPPKVFLILGRDEGFVDLSLRGGHVYSAVAAPRTFQS